MSFFSTAYYDSKQNTVAIGGSYFGSLYFPQYRGSRGGHGLTSQGGRGGGYIHLTISSHLLVDGTIDVDGSHAEPAASKVDAGGGSGGAVYIRYFNNGSHVEPAASKVDAGGG